MGVEGHGARVVRYGSRVMGVHGGGHEAMRAMGEERPGAMGLWGPWGVEGHGARRWVFTGAAPAPAGVGG